MGEACDALGVQVAYVAEWDHARWLPGKVDAGVNVVGNPFPGDALLKKAGTGSSTPPSVSGDRPAAPLILQGWIGWTRRAGRVPRRGVLSAFGLGNGPGGVDEPDVAEGLREVAQELPAHGIDLLS